MHRLVQCDHKEAAAEGGELLCAFLRWRLGRLVEVGLAQRFQKLEVARAQLLILRSNLGERWIRAGVVEDPGTVPVVDDARDEMAGKADANDRMRDPASVVLAQADDGGLAICNANAHSPRNRHALVAGEIRSIGEWAGEAVRHAQM